MPFYEYACEDCGPFDGWASMAEALEPRPCPGCHAVAPRTMARPHVRGSRAGLCYLAESRNEKSAHEPAVERRLGNGKGCHQPGHGSPRRRPGAAPHRPWMVGH